MQGLCRVTVPALIPGAAAALRGSHSGGAPAINMEIGFCNLLKKSPLLLSKEDRGDILIYQRPLKTPERLPD